VFYESVKKRTGLDFHSYKAVQLQRRIVTMAGSKGSRTLGEFWNWLVTEKGHMEWFLDRMAINVSELFRNPDKWEDLKTHVIPRLLQKSKRLKCWSAGCSYGAEAYTLAMILESRFPGAHRVVGTDIDDAALLQANSGQFSQSDVRAVPKAYKERFLVAAGDKWVADEGLKRYLTFKKQNLLEPQGETGFDLILCRNVVIYFTEEAKTQLYRRFCSALRPGGFLFVGSTERIFGASELGFVPQQPFFYQKPELGDSTWRNAS
jgi:chemotaxis protein methyltransferase CheR